MPGVPDISPRATWQELVQEPNAMLAADVAPTANTRTAITAARANAARVMARYAALKAAAPGK